MQCYSSDQSIADGYFRVLAEVYMRQEIPKCEIQRLLSLILYKVVDPSRQIRDDALQMLETLSAREWVEEGEGAGDVSIVGLSASSSSAAAAAAAVRYIQNLIKLRRTRFFPSGGIARAELTWPIPYLSTSDPGVAGRSFTWRKEQKHRTLGRPKLKV